MSDIEAGDQPAVVESEDIPYAVGLIKKKFDEAEQGRLSDEQRWLNSYKNYRGVYDSSTQFKGSERSKVFVKVTKTKVLASFGQITDILFSQGKVPISIEATPIPEGISEFASLDVSKEAIMAAMQQPQQEMQFGGEVEMQNQGVGFEGDGKSWNPGQLDLGEQQGLDEMPAQLNGLEAKFGQSEKLVQGPAKLGEPQIKPAAIAAQKMQKVIDDQLTEAHAVSVMRHAIFECVMMGTGIVKGPFHYEKDIHNWEQNPETGERTYVPLKRLVPKLEAVSCWDFYPDPSAVDMKDAEYAIQRHRLNRQQVRDLKNKPFFDLEAIEECLDMGSNFQKRGFEDDIYSDDDPTYMEDRFEVLEYWGTLDSAMAEEIGMEMPEDATELKELQVNIWICGNTILRAVVNPFTPSFLPYHAFPYELNPYQFFGVGVPENMEDAQMIMNGHMRMAIDNLSLAGNMVFDIDETLVVPGQSMEIHPGKIFRRQSGQAGQSVVGLKFPNTAGENIQMYDKARQLADEETGIPSIAHGQTGVTGTGRTASGLSMLLNSAGLSIKTVVKNIDDYLLKPVGESFYRWNMQFNVVDIDAQGDLEVKAKGTSSVMAKEVRSQRLTTLLQTVSNPMLAPFIKIPNLIKELAISQDIDPEELVNDTNQAAIFADILRGLNVQQGAGEEAGTVGQQPQGMAGTGGAPAGANPQDISGVGGGTIGTGSTPIAGEDGFTGTPPEPEDIGVGNSQE